MIKNNHHNGDKNRRFLYYFACVIFAFLFLLILGEKGPIIEEDSAVFIQPSRNIKQAYPLYTAFLFVCHTIWDTKNYLYVVYILQSAFAFITSFIFTEYLRKYFRLKFSLAFVIFVFSFLPYGYSLPENVVNHHILTEAIAFPLFSVYMLFVFKTFLENKRKYMVGVGCLTLLLFWTRSQLMLLFPVYIGLWIIIFLRRVYCKRNPQKRRTFFIGLIVGICLSIGLAFLTIGKVVEKLEIGQFTDAVMGRVLCVVDEDDAYLFEGVNKEVFEQLYEEVEQSGYRYVYFREGIWKWEDILEATNENTLMYYKKISSYYEQIGSEAVFPNTVESASEIASTLFYHHLDDYLMMSFHLFLQSFVVAIFIHPTSIFTLCYILAILLYVMASITLLYANFKMKIDVKYSIPLLFTLLMIGAIVLITNLIFYGLQRYVVYAFGCFYISWLILFVGIYREWRKRRV